MPRTYQVLFALAGKSTPCPGSAQEYAAAAWPANPVRALADAIRGLGHRVSLVGTGSRADDGASGTIAGRQADAPACDVVVVVPQDARSVAGWPRDVTTARWRTLWLDRAELARGSGPSRVRLCLRGVGPLRRPFMSRWGLASDRMLTTGLGV